MEETQAPPSATAVIRFEAGWTNVVEGELHEEGQFLVAYDFARMPNCRGERLGVPSWWMEAYVRFHPSGQQDMYRLTGTPLQLAIPAGTQHIELWFRNWDARHCQAWDSQHGLNYWFPVSARNPPSLDGPSLKNPDRR